MTKMDLLEKVLKQLISGRLFCTVVVVLVYAVLAINGILPTDKISEITLLVLYAYFTKNRENGNGNGGETTTTTTTLLNAPKV